MSEEKVFRLWKPIELTDNWLECDTTVFDGVSDAWYAKRSELQANSKEFTDFMAQLKREHAIETGVIERLYDLDRGITETLIRKGFIDVEISHSQTNVPVSKLWDHLQDHMKAVDFVFEVVKDDRPFTIGFLHDLHALITRHQDTTEGRDQFGHVSQIPLLKGKFKEMENNPTRPDGTKVLYCSPIHVASEMDRLVAIYNEIAEHVHPIIQTAWVHHAFTTIHPYQDGNGRVARLLASLILIKHGLFPFTVRREEAKTMYIDSLEKADLGNPQPLVSYLCEAQREHIGDALNLRDEAKPSSLEEMARIFSGKLEEWQSAKRKEHEDKVALVRESVFNFCLKSVEVTVEKLKLQFNGSAELSISSCPPSNTSDASRHYYGQIIKYAKKHNYYFNRFQPKGWIKLTIGLNKEKWYQLGFSMHHQGSDDGTLVIGAFLEDTTNRIEHEERIDATLPLEIRPVLVSTQGDAAAKSQLIGKFVEHAITMSLGHIAHEL